MGLFVISKSHEISRRLEHIAGSVRRWAEKYNEDRYSNGANNDSTNIKDTAEASARMLLRKHRKFVKYEKELLRLGDDINALQRFASAQVVAFRKILKKYKVSKNKRRRRRGKKKVEEELRLFYTFWLCSSKLEITVLSMTANHRGYRNGLAHQLSGTAFQKISSKIPRALQGKTFHPSRTGMMRS